MRLVPVIALLLLASPIVGCVGNTVREDADPEQQSLDPAELAPKQYDVLPVEEVRIPSSVDGKTVHNAVYRPDTNETVPVFVNFSPYWGDSATERGDAFARYMIEEYVPRGYAVVLSAIRGTGHSEGCFQIASDKELQDLYDVIDRFADANWSNGNVVAGGKSYDSTPQNGLIAKHPHPALEGIFHVSGITDMYRYTYRQGVSYVHGPIFNTYYYGQGIHEYGLPGGLGTGAPAGASSYEDEDAGSLSRAVDDAACPEFPEQQANGVGSGVHGMKTDYWIERDWNQYVPQTDWNGSIFFVHGLQDWNVKPDHVLPWLERLPDPIRVKGWLHQDTSDGTGHVYPMRADWNDTMLRWLEHVGKDKQTGIDWGFQVEGNDGVWRESKTWPPDAADHETREIRNYTEYFSGAHKENRVRILGPVNETVRYAGQPVIHAHVLVEGNEDPVFTAVLYDKAPDGSMTWVNEGVQRGILREGLTEPTPVPQGEPFEVEIPMYPQDDVLEPGHSWVAILGQEPRHAVVAPNQLSQVTYDHHGNRIEIPFAPADTGLEDQPEEIPCFAC